MCRCSVTEAFYFSRGLGETSHRNLFEKLLNFVLTSSTGTVSAARGMELIGLPLNDEEEAWFEHYLKNGDGRTMTSANDTLIMRAQLTGKSKTLLEYGKNINGRKIDGVNWAALRDSMQRGSRSAENSTAAFTL